MADSKPSVSTKKRPYTGPTYKYDHPGLGSLTGRLFNSSHSPDCPVVQFRSIPYARVSRRFAPCAPLDNIPEEFDGRPHGDFTQFGAACPQAASTKTNAVRAYGGPLADDLDIEFDEFTCLTVSISVPQPILAASADSREQARCPVMVYIHGGAAQEGTGHVDGLHSNAPLSAYSSQISLATIVVNIGYRLNWLGSLVCQDMLDEYHTDPSVSPHGPFNLTIQDQRAAFAWIHKFIGGFGGDVERITAFGESAGSLFLVYHICGSQERLFNRAILQSGVVFGHMTLERKDSEYQGILKHFAIEGASARERLEKLRQVPADALADLPGSHTMPFLDESAGLQFSQPLFPRGSPTFIGQMSLLASCSWLDAVVIGDDFFEGYVLKDQIPRNTSVTGFVETTKSIFSESLATKLLEKYDLPTDVHAAAQSDGNRCWGNLMYFVGDLLFSEPIHRIANHIALCNSAGGEQGKKIKLYRYSFGLSNPFPGSDNSYVTGHHFVEILFLFLTLLDRYPRHRGTWLEEQARETAKSWLMFANGQEPWDEYIIAHPGESGDAQIALCDDIRGWYVKTVTQDAEQSRSDPWGPRRYEQWAAIEEAFRSLRGAEMDLKAWDQDVSMARMRILHVVSNPSGVRAAAEAISGET